eukprot:c12551_g1_i1.p1 GENE.c12551_g1_i1~~c12551_g1_i1.p1  ORF type:complete len:166 (+),score=16.69 c12551_g1_i1:37-534(+)
MYLSCFLNSGPSPTIEDTYHRQDIIDKRPCVVRILDTAGQEDFREALLDSWLKFGQGYLLVYSVSDPKSFGDIMLFYDAIKRCRPDEDVPILLVGNKSDLVQQRVVTSEEGRDLANSQGMAFLETSALADVNVLESFQALVRMIRHARTIVSRPNRSNTRDCVVM